MQLYLLAADNEMQRLIVATNMKNHLIDGHQLCSGNGAITAFGGIDAWRLCQLLVRQVLECFKRGILFAILAALPCRQLRVAIPLARLVVPIAASVSHDIGARVLRPNIHLWLHNIFFTPFAAVFVQATASMKIVDLIFSGDSRANNEHVQQIA